LEGIPTAIRSQRGREGIKSLIRAPLATRRRKGMLGAIIMQCPDNRSIREAILVNTIKGRVVLEWGRTLTTTKLLAMLGEGRVRQGIQGTKTT